MLGRKVVILTWLNVNERRKPKIRFHTIRCGNPTTSCITVVYFYFVTPQLTSRGQSSSDSDDRTELISARARERGLASDVHWRN